MTKVNRQFGEQAILGSVTNNAAIVKDALDINNHQRLPVLFCSYYHNPGAASSFCAQPFLLNMSFYGENDIMLGQFLERYCFRSSYICSSCKLPMMDHVRRYVHSMGCIQVKLTEDLHAYNLPHILMTSWCTICQSMTPSVPMQKDTWCYSFGKYLEMRFYGHAYRRRQLDKSESTAIKSEEDGINQPFCTHSLHRDHVQYFSFNGIVATFTYSTIEVWEIHLPSLKISLKMPQLVDPSQFVTEVKNFSMSGYDVYAKIYEKLAILFGDTEYPMLGTLKKNLNSDQLIFREKVGVVQNLMNEKSVKISDIEDAILLMKKNLAENIDLWTQRLNEATTQSRTMSTTAKLPSQQQEMTASTASQSGSIDAGTICTEELNSEPESPTSISDVHPDINKLDFVSNEETTNDIDVNNTEREQRSTVASVTSDKKSVKTILRELLPSDKHIQNILQSPFPLNEHHSLPMGEIPVLVHDQDLSSVIAYSLVSLDYKRALRTLYYNETHRKSYDSCAESDDKDSEKEKKSKTSSHVEIYFQDLSTQFTCKIYFARDFDLMRSKFIEPERKDDAAGVKPSNRKHTTSTSESDGYFSKELDRKSSSNSLSVQSVLDSPRTDDEANDAQQKYINNIRNTFARSLSKSVRWEARGGKSGSKFCKTLGTFCFLYKI